MSIEFYCDRDWDGKLSGKVSYGTKATAGKAAQDNDGIDGD